MTSFIDALVALGVVSGLSATMIAISQGWGASPWLRPAPPTGPVSPMMLPASGSRTVRLPLHGCAACFERPTYAHGLGPRCRAPKRKPSRASRRRAG